VKFRGQYFRGVASRLLCAFWLPFCILGLVFSAGVAHGQNASRLPVVAENQSDLSLLAGPITVSPPGGQRVQTTKPSSVWPWESGGETPDPAIVFGRLANGMRYAIKRNSKPENEVAVRFRYDVGSNYEEDHQLGYAHFLEHMAFNGSTNVPEGEFVKRMERLGAAFGRHVNASTSNDETIYQFDLPNAGQGRLELALDLFRETADRLTLSQEAIDREKGIVSSEQITRSSPMRDQYLARNKRLYPRMRDTNRDPIGTISSIEAVTSQSLRSFYQRWYRPDRAILVIVGDIDVDATEAMIKDRFASWKPTLEEPNPPKPSDGQWEGNKLSVYIERSNTEQEEFIIESERPDSRLFEDGSREEAIVRSYVQTLTFNILNGRLVSAATRGDNPPYLSGSYGGPFGGPGNSRGLGWRAQIDFEPRGRDWRRGMKFLALEMRQVLRDGFSQEDRNRAVANFSREYPDAGFADIFDNSAMTASNIMQAVVNGYTPLAKQDRASRRAELLRRLEQVTVERLNEEARFYWRGVQPRFLITTQDPSVTEASVIAAWREALAAPIPPRQVIQPVRFEPIKLGPASRLAGRWREPGLDADFVRFENGVTLVVMPNLKPLNDPTQHKGPDEVAIIVQLGAGSLAFGDGDGAWASVADFEWERAGFANLKSTDLGGAFRETGLDRISSDLGLTRTRMNTSALRSDLNLMLDVLLAKIVSPRLGTDGIGLYADRLRQRARGRQQTAEDVFRQKRLSLYQTGSPLFKPRTPEETLQTALNTDVAEANGKLRAILNKASVSVIIVGDIDMDTAIAAVGTRFGALPKRRGMETGIAVARNWRFRDGGGPAQVFQHGGNDDQALVNVAWQVPNVPKGPATYSLDLLKAIFQVRANDVIREAYGQTYSPSVQITRLPGYGDNVVLAVSAIVLPKDVESVEARIITIASDLATSGPTGDEVSRARNPLVEAQNEDCKDNECWVGKISNVLAQRAVGEREARPWSDSADYLPALRALTREELQALARRYFVDTRLIKVHVLPGAKVGETVAN
jgi:zinc protease